MTHEDDEERVGYKRPPRHSRFRKGASGNPKGRPKGSAMRSAVEKVLDRKVTATVDGRTRKVPLTEALVLQLVQRALRGDVAANRELMKVADQIEAARVQTDANKPTKVIIRWAMPADDCNPALEKLGAIVEVDGKYKIEPWLLEAALARNPDLTQADRLLIANNTRQPGERPSQKLLDWDDYKRMRAERQLEERS